MLTPNIDQLAERAIDRYYDDEIYDGETMELFIENSRIPLDPEWTQQDHLAQAILDDIHDLLANGDNDDLAWDEEEVEAIRTSGYNYIIFMISRTIAQKLMERI